MDSMNDVKLIKLHDFKANIEDPHSPVRKMSTIDNSLIMDAFYGDPPIRTIEEANYYKAKLSEYHPNLFNPTLSFNCSVANAQSSGVTKYIIL